MPNGLTWRQHARQVIASVDSKMRADIAEKDARHTLSQAYPYSYRQGFVYKVWLSEVGRYLQMRFHPETLGATPKKRDVKVPEIDPAQEVLF